MVLKCLTCLKDYIPKKKSVKNSKFCSHKCACESFKKRTNKICQECGQSYEIPISADKGSGRSKYCSQRCRRNVLAKLLTKNKNTKCLVCENIFIQKPSHAKKFCSLACYRIFQKTPTWQKSFSISNIGKLNAFKKKSHHCLACQSISHIEIHHLDGNQFNNSSENWMPLCQVCHHNLHNLFKESQKSLTSFSFSFVKMMASFLNEK